MSDIKINGLKQQKLNTWILFPNKRKEKESHPDYKGAMNVDDKDKEISGWVKTLANGDTYFTGTVQDPWVKGQPRSAPQQISFAIPAIFVPPVSSSSVDDDDIFI